MVDKEEALVEAVAYQEEASLVVELAAAEAKDGNIKKLRSDKNDRDYNYRFDSSSCTLVYISLQQISIIKNEGKRRIFNNRCISK